MIFVEAPEFERIPERYLDDVQYRLLQLALMANSESGDMIRGSGGIRKVRWACAWQRQARRFARDLLLDYPSRLPAAVDAVSQVRGLRFEA
jgi:hypothetical protein